MKQTFFYHEKDKHPYDNCTFEDLKISFLKVKRLILRNVHMTFSHDEAQKLAEIAEMTSEITDPGQQLFLAKLASRVIQLHQLDKIRELIACAAVENITFDELQSLKTLKAGNPLRLYSEVRFQAYFIAAIENAEKELERRACKRVHFNLA